MPVSVLSSRDFHAWDGAIVDARGLERFLAGHIPGAVWMGWDRWTEHAPVGAESPLAQPGYWGVQESGRDVAERLSAGGLTNDTPVVVYSSGPPSRGREGRIAWMLLYAGVREVALLDGGWPAWLDRGGAVELGETETRHGRFVLRLDGRRRRTLAQLHAALGRDRLPLMIDTRSSAEFAGDEAPYLPVRGHLPGAVHVDSEHLFTAGGGYLSAEEYRCLVPPAIFKTRHRVAYCEVGVRAGLFAVLHEAYTGEVMPVYDGSLIEWGLAGLPVER